MPKEIPDKIPELSDDAEKSVDQKIAAYEARLRTEETMREQEKSCLKELKARVVACVTEEEFLSVMQELERESIKIKDTVMVSGIDVKFGKKEYDVFFTVKPRRTFDHADEPIKYMVWYTKAI